MFKDHYPQVCPSTIKEGQTLWRVTTDMDVDNPERIKTNVELVEVGVKTLRKAKNAPEGSAKTAYLVDKIPGITFLKIRPSDKKHSVWNQSISSLFKHEVEIGRTFPVGIRTTKSAAYRTALKKTEQSIQNHIAEISRLEKELIQDLAEITEWKNELAAYQTMFKTLKRMANKAS